MRILIVTQYFWPENFRINDIVIGLQQQGHTLTILTGHPNYPSGTFAKGYSGRRVKHDLYNDMRVFRVPLFPRGQKSGLKLALNYFSFAFSGAIYALLCLKNEYDCIFVYEPSPMTVGFPAIALKFKIRKPIVFYIQDLWPDSLLATGFVKNPQIIKAVESMVRMIYRACDKILVTSKAFIPKVQQAGYPLASIAYLPQYAEAFYRPVEPDPSDPAQPTLPEGFKVVFAGNMGTAQDLFTVLDAAEKTINDGINWVFLGDGSVKEDLKTQSECRNINNVFFLGSFPAETMPQFFARADALLVSLTNDALFALTIPAKLQSYLACAKPILAMLNGEGATIVRDSNSGLVIAPGDSSQLAQAARQLKQISLEQRQQMGKNGRQYYEREFDRSTILAKLDDIFHSVQVRS